MSLRQPFPPVQMPMVDAAGIPTPAWVQFFLSLFSRTNGAIGPTAPLTGDDTTALMAFLDADLEGMSADLSALTGQVAAAAAAASDAQELAVLSEIEATRSDDQAAFLAQLLAD